jgi:hypothetical protein
MIRPAKLHTSALDVIPALEADPSALTPTQFRRDFMIMDKPAVLRGIAAKWPAVSHPQRAWKNWERLSEDFGERLVSVEVADVFYQADALTGVRIPFGLYLSYMHEYARKRHSWPADVKNMYLGQTDLFSDIPELQSDISVPSLM